MGQGSTLCKILFGLLFGILATLCSVGSIVFDEITKTQSSLGTAICGKESLWFCTGGIDECNDALVYGYNVEGVGIDEENGIFITELAVFEDACDGLFGGTIFEVNDDEACDQLDAGKAFYYLNIAATILSVIAMVFLLTPVTRGFSAALFILSAVTCSAAIVAFIGLSIDNTCWNREDYDPEPAASAWMDIAGAVLFVVAASCSMGFPKDRD